MSMMRDIHIGTAGWNVPARYAGNFPARERPGGGTHLERYAAVMNAVELNSSFYKPHRRETYVRWSESVPADFRFAVKIPKAATHERRLVDCTDLLDGFAGQVGGLGAKLGVLLLQLPPSLHFDAGIAGAFFAALQARVAAPVACEPRHASWFAPGINDWLAERQIARVAADPVPKMVPKDAAAPGGWSGLAYYRWHGSPRVYYSDYEAAALAALRERADADAARGAEVWCVFDNTAEAAALGNALSLAAC